jgi:cytochrome c oxidase subunit 2
MPAGSSIRFDRVPAGKPCVGLPAARLVTPVVLVLALAGCGTQQNVLAPESHPSRDIASLWWWMLGASALGAGLVAGLLLLAWVRRSRRGIGRDTRGLRPGERVSTIVVLALGVALPLAVISALFVLSDIFVIRTSQAPAANRTRLTVQVVGHQWYWEVRYPGTAAVTANEINIPVRTPVLLEATTADVIHSFWVPRLNRKIDMIPGQTNRILLEADAPGSYRGQCAEFCGLQHAHMAMIVFAQPQAAFRRWLAAQAEPARPAISALARRGERLFLQPQSCQSCHTIRGTAASGDTGPDLTHVASRTTLAAVTIRNDPGGLADWIGDPQHVKPGNKMPDLPLTSAQVRALVAYFGSLH